jgi:D-beta-D-heptose 7-phosphate kinase/D-beta-D-heptose 1-phosphate adenosyltransferase
MKLDIEQHHLTRVPDFSKGKLLVVGDVMLDSYWHGVTNRISPEAPVPIVKIEQEEIRVGGAGNVALNVASLGASASLIALVGKDSAAEQLIDLLRHSNVTPILQEVLGSKTITKLRIVSKNQQLLRADFEDNFPHWDSHRMLAEFKDQLANVDVVLLSDYKKGTLKNCEELILAAKNLGKPVVVDPKGTEFSLYRGATIITPNMSEFEAVVGICHSDDEIVQRGIALREHLDLEAVLITRSEKGMTLLARGHEPFHLPTRAQEVFDVTGAGDTVVATLGAALAAGLPMHEAVMLSNIAAGIVVAKLGTATVTVGELRSALHTDPRDERAYGFIPEQRLISEVLAARALGERIVMTNGCFDLLHPGHLDYLEEARSLGNRLVVAINDDMSVSKLKGPERPINPLVSRARMLAGLQAVDWVVSFSEDTPARLIAEVNPDVLVKGGDYHIENVVGAQTVLNAGGTVHVLSFIEGCSTTSLIEKIQGKKL